MKSTKILTMLVIALAAVASLPAKAQLVVGTCVAGTQYPTIQTAVNAAPSGSTIKVCPGGYQEQVVIEKPLTLVGIISGGAEGAWILPPTGGWAATDPTSTYTPQVLVKNATGVTINNLIVEAANNNAQCGMHLTGILFHNASGTVNKAAVRNQLTINSAIQCIGYGLVAVVDNQQAQTVLVENTDFRNNGYQALTAWGPGLTMNAAGNFVTGGDNSQIGGIGIAYLAGATGTVQGNTVTNEIDIYGGAGPALSNATGIAVDCASATVTGNVVTSTQLGIYIGCSATGATSGISTVTQNRILYTKIADGIYVSSSGNSITKNTIVAAASSGIHLDTTAGGTGNIVSGNTVTEACTGVLTTTVTLENSDFRNNGGQAITGDGQGLTMNIQNNYVAGPDNTAGPVAGIVLEFSATGTIQGNTVVDEYNTFVNTNVLSGSLGIGIGCASGTITGNTIADTQNAIYLGCPEKPALQGNSTVTNNKIFETRHFDGIYVFGGVNTVSNNTIVGSGSSGIHLDTTGGSVNNVVSGNTITEACTGILTTGTGSNKLSANTFNAVYVPTQKGTGCGPIF